VRAVDEVHRGRGGSATHALSGVSLSVAPGEFVSLVGRSGCGKTTLLRIMAGLIAPSGGRVLAGGRDLWQGGRRDTAAR
jgi:NitT/TauT family transport system ATP-binding protein